MIKHSIIMLILIEKICTFKLLSEMTIFLVCWKSCLGVLKNDSFFGLLEIFLKLLL
jgi:hypothetical protein